MPKRKRERIHQALSKHTGLEKLPIDVLGVIFAFIYIDERNNVKLCCTTLFEAESRLPLRHIHVSSRTTLSSMPCHVSVTRLREVQTLSSESDMHQKWMHNLVNLRTIRACCARDDMCTLSFCEKLQYACIAIHLGRSDMGTDYLDAILQAASSLTQLVELRFQGLDLTTYSSWSNQIFLHWLVCMPVLHTLELVPNANCCDFDITHLTRSQSLKRIHVELPPGCISHRLAEQQPTFSARGIVLTYT